MNFHITVPEDFQNSVRLDSFVASHTKGMNRSHLKSTATDIFLNKKRAKLSSKVKSGDVIDIEYEETVPSDIVPENIPLKIIFENKDVAVVNKSRGMVTHPATGNWNGTLVNALLFHWNKDSIHSAGKDSFTSCRTGIVHRLDKDTTGVIITAKNRDAEEWLCAQFSKRKVRKEYVAIVQGRPPAVSGDIRTKIIRDPKDRKKFVAVSDTEKGKFARTIYHCVATYGQYSVMRLRIKTGRTHQIRVHMKYLGCRILGDPIYAKRDSTFPNAPLMLHSRLLEIRLPNEKNFTTFRADFPDDFLDIYKTIRKKYPRAVQAAHK